MNFHTYFTSLGFSENEVSIYQDLVGKEGRPASVIAQSVLLDRTTVYKILLRFVEKWIVTEHSVRGVKNFCVENLSDLQSYVIRKARKFQSLEKVFPSMSESFQSSDDFVWINSQKIMHTQMYVVGEDDSVEGIKSRHVYASSKQIQDFVSQTSDVRFQEILGLIDQKRITHMLVSEGSLYLVFNGDIDLVLQVTSISILQWCRKVFDFS